MRQPPFTLHEDSWYSFLLEPESTPRAIVWLEGLGQLKNPVTSSGIETATLQLNQLRYRVPPFFYKVNTFLLFDELHQKIIPYFITK
jgi:hypothetical protein